MDKFYPIFVVPLPAEEGGGYFGYAPDLIGCMSHGDTPEEALANARQASQEWIEESRAHNREIPEPGAAIARAQKEREALLTRIRDQSMAIDKFENDISMLRDALINLTERLSADVPPWSSFISARVLSNGCDSDEAVH